VSPARSKQQQQASSPAAASSGIREGNEAEEEEEEEEEEVGSLAYLTHPDGNSRASGIREDILELLEGRPECAQDKAANAVRQGVFVGMVVGFGL
jgi:hypothetical protein